MCVGFDDRLVIGYVWIVLEVFFGVFYYFMDGIGKFFITFLNKMKFVFII